MKNLVEYIQIQRSLQSDEMRECYGCSKHLRVTAYCFKCNDFLCEDCQNFHLTNKFLKDHQKHTLSLKDVESKNITIKKLASMRDAPSCHSHPEKVSELYCETCDNLPVCVACMLGDHKGHNLHEVQALATSKREILAQKLKSLEELDQDFKLSTLAQVKKKIISNVTHEKEKMTKVYTDVVHRTKAKLHHVQEKQEIIKQEKQNTEKQVFDSLHSEMEKEIQEVRRKFEEMLKVKKNEISDVFHGRESFVKNEVAKLNGNLERFDEDRNVLLESIEMQLNKNIKDIDAISEHFGNTKKRVQNLKVLASSIIASENDWTAVQCIPDMSTAADNLINDLKKEFPELETSANVTVSYKRTSFGNSRSNSKISEEVERKLTIEACHFVDGVRGHDGNIVISGCQKATAKASIIMIDENGKVIRQTTITGTKKSPYHYCDFLSQNEVVTVFSPHNIVVYNVLDGSHKKKSIPDLIHSWPVHRSVKCVATDPVSNHILVGGDRSRDVYVFDDQLNYLHILTLPEMIQWPQDITICDGYLLVCDFDGKKSYVTTIDGLKIKVVMEFIKPDLRGSGWSPWSICTDRNGLVYMLWKYEDTNQCYLVQYTHNGSDILSTRKIDGNSYAIAAVETSQGEKLFVVTHNTQTVYLYGLLNED
ncbi:Transcription intermediary factor 1-beta [Holothuria leucospilota]|uniref:Transcription intermediary factor 1-beta n=1 Tax=Holothuria leucospilota TaxID=206669 RepID=A0A9Q1BU50_HOLLE|nr:Transcription intermediary factor 1-beta [Holothuria leucospilota]